MASRVQKIMFWDTLKNAKSVILHFFPVAEIGRNIHLLYFSYPQEIYSQFVEWEKNVLSPYSPQWSVYFPVLLLLITQKHPVSTIYRAGMFVALPELRPGVAALVPAVAGRGLHCPHPGGGAAPTPLAALS